MRDPLMWVRARVAPKRQRTEALKVAMTSHSLRSFKPSSTELKMEGEIPFGQADTDFRKATGDRLSLIRLIITTQARANRLGTIQSDVLKISLTAHPPGEPLLLHKLVLKWEIWAPRYSAGLSMHKICDNIKK